MYSYLFQGWGALRPRPRFIEGSSKEVMVYVVLLVRMETELPRECSKFQQFSEEEIRRR